PAAFDLDVIRIYGNFRSHDVFLECQEWLKNGKNADAIVPHAPPAGKGIAAVCDENCRYKKTALRRSSVNKRHQRDTVTRSCTTARAPA
ncbi:MAG: hypothetical protein ACFNTM_04990, partial [Cardiobacterium sp.]